MNNRILNICLLLVFICLLGSCKPGTNTTTGNNNAAASGKELKLAFVTNNASDYWTIARKGVEKADAEMDDVTVDLRCPAAAQRMSKSESSTI